MGELSDRYVLWFQEIGIEHIPLVGGKNASLGEMIHHFKKKNINIRQEIFCQVFMQDYMMMKK